MIKILTGILEYMVIKTLLLPIRKYLTLVEMIAFDLNTSKDGK